MHGGFHPDVPITYLEGIKPKLVRRSNWDTWSIAENLGVTVVELLSRGPYGTEDCNIINWKNHIVNVVNKAKTYKGTVNYQYDIWNESNRSEFWSGNCGNWYDWWEYAYNLIKSEKDGLDQNVAIVGPSYSNFSFSRISSFLNYCKENNCLPDIINWHEWTNTIGQLEKNYQTLVEFIHENEINNKFGEPISRFQINEYHYTSYNKPGNVVAVFFASMERCPLIEAAGRAYWTSTAREQLNHLLSSTDPMQPTSIWWAYKEYASLKGTVHGIQYSSSVNGIVTSDSNSGFLKGLFGRINTSGDIEINFTNIDVMSIYKEVKAVNITTHFIRNTGSQPSEGPQKISESNYSISNNSIKLIIPNVINGDAFTFTIRPIIDKTHISRPTGFHIKFVE